MSERKRCIFDEQAVNSHNQFHWPDQETVLLRAKSGKLLVPWVQEVNQNTTLNPGAQCSLDYLLTDPDSELMTLGSFPCFVCGRGIALRGVNAEDLKNLNLEKMKIIDLDH